MPNNLNEFINIYLTISIAAIRQAISKSLVAYYQKCKS